MNERLAVNLNGVRIGVLVGKAKNAFDFLADAEAIQTFGLGSHVLSLSVPLVTKPAADKASRRRNFFAEMLPEGVQLKNLADDARIPTDDVIGLLALYGRDVAGAVEIFPENESATPGGGTFIPISNSEIAKLLQNTRTQPLGNIPSVGRTSIAGVQEKIVLAQVEGQWGQVGNGLASTHILKPAPIGYPTMIFDEAYGHAIAQALGLANFSSQIVQFDGVPALVIERYDRTKGDHPERIHQEDMNQALGAAGNEKYQEYGGKISARRIAETLQKYTTNQECQRLLKQLVVAQAIGNLDMHAKNISILHLQDSTMSLAPAYDMVPLTHQDAGGRMAMSVNGKYAHAAIRMDDLVNEATSWGLNNMEGEIRATIQEVQDFVGISAPPVGAFPLLQEQILCYTSRLLSGQETGTFPL